MQKKVHVTGSYDGDQYINQLCELAIIMTLEQLPDDVRATQLHLLADDDVEVEEALILMIISVQKLLYGLAEEKNDHYLALIQSFSRTLKRTALENIKTLNPKQVMYDAHGNVVPLRKNYYDSREKEVKH